MLGPKRSRCSLGASCPSSFNYSGRWPLQGREGHPGLQQGQHVAGKGLHGEREQRGPQCWPSGVRVRAPGLHSQGASGGERGTLPLRVSPAPRRVSARVKCSGERAGAARLQVGVRQGLVPPAQVVGGTIHGCAGKEVLTGDERPSSIARPPGHAASS